MSLPQAEAIVRQYGAILMQGSDGMHPLIRPISLLSHSKDQIKLAIKTILPLATAGAVESLKTGYMELASFVDDRDALVAAKANGSRDPDALKHLSTLLNASVKESAFLLAEIESYASAVERQAQGE